MILVRDTKEVYRHQVESAVGENASAKQVLDYLLGHHVHIMMTRKQTLSFGSGGQTRRGRLCTD